MYFVNYIALFTKPPPQKGSPLAFSKKEVDIALIELTCLHNSIQHQLQDPPSQNVIFIHTIYKVITSDEPILSLTNNNWGQQDLFTIDHLLVILGVGDLTRKDYKNLIKPFTNWNVFSQFLGNNQAETQGGGGTRQLPSPPYVVYPCVWWMSDLY